jgi:hypothetical protein
MLIMNGPTTVQSLASRRCVSTAGDPSLEVGATDAMHGWRDKASRSVPELSPTVDFAPIIALVVLPRPGIKFPSRKKASMQVCKLVARQLGFFQ